MCVSDLKMIIVPTNLWGVKIKTFSVLFKIIRKNKNFNKKLVFGKNDFLFCTQKGIIVDT